MTTLGHVAAIWRYPVKALAPESMLEAVVDPDGLRGDRVSALFVRAGNDARMGKTFRGKEHNLLHTVDDPDRAVALAADRGVRVERRAENVHHFDDSPVSLIVDRWVDDVSVALGVSIDPLRFRPNFFVRALPEFARSEADLVGSDLEIGAVVLRVRSTIDRCVTITYDVQTGERDDRVLRYVAQQRANVMGVYCDVLDAGRAGVGDAVCARDR